MNATRFASLPLLCSLALTGIPYAALSAPGKSTAKPPQSRPATAPIPVLSFTMTTRIGYRAPGQQPLPEQLIRANIMLSGNRARVETNNGGERSIVLFTPPYVYRLLPAVKAGVVWQVDPKKNRSMGSFNARELLSNPGQIRAILLENGARKTGTAKLGNVPVEIYEAKNFREQGTTARAWLRSSDALPLRFELSGGSLHVVASWQNYSRPKNVTAAAFAVPGGYKIRVDDGQPPFSAL